MDEKNDINDLNNFINSKCNEKSDVGPLQLYIYYQKAIKNALQSTYSHQNTISDSIICKDIVANIFWLIFNYSKNIKLTMFMSERVILLYNEYLNISITYGNENVNIVDVKTFIINKTIGPLKIQNTKQNDLFNIQDLCVQMENFLTNLFIYIRDKDEHILDDIILLVSPLAFKLYNIGLIYYNSKIMNSWLQSEPGSLSKKINLDRIQMELVYLLFGQTGDYSYTIEKVDELMEKNISYINSFDEMYDLSEENDVVIKEKIVKKLVQLLNI
jgi:hypothetical protein